MGKEPNLVWIDTEWAGGLGLEFHPIMEIAVIVTDSDLNQLNEGLDLVINLKEDDLKKMDQWNWDVHTSTGLLDKVRKSKITKKEAENQVIEEILKYCEPKISPLCGNTVWMDRIHIMNDFPRVNEILHYRNIDVSTVKELYKLWYPGEPLFEKKETHLAIEDIKESIVELKFYKQKIFRGL